MLNQLYKLLFISFTTLLLCVLSYTFYSEAITSPAFIRLLTTVFSFLISFSFCFFVLDNFNYSENKYLRIMQRFFFLNILIIFLSVLIFYLFYHLSIFTTIYCSGEENTTLYLLETLNKNKEISSQMQDVAKIVTDSKYYHIQIDKESFNTATGNALEIAKIAIENAVPNIGAGAAAGAVGSAVIKASANLPLLNRLAVLGLTTATTAVATSVGINVASAIVKSSNLKAEITTKLNSQSTVSATSESQVEQAGPKDNYFNSPLESGDSISPLQDLLLSSLLLDIITLLLLIIVFIFIFNRYILSFNLNIINKIFNKYRLSITIRNWFNNKLNTSANFNNKFLLCMFIFCTLLLVCILFLKIFISSELFMNINSHIEVHNYFHSKKS